MVLIERFMGKRVDPQTGGKLYIIVQFVVLNFVNLIMFDQFQLSDRKPVYMS